MAILERIKVSARRRRSYFELLNSSWTKPKREKVENGFKFI
jgi:hypothetical protein